MTTIYIYRRTFKRTVQNGCIIYAGMTYTSVELFKLNGQVVQITKFGSEPNTFDISRLLVNTIPYKKDSLFWVF